MKKGLSPEDTIILVDAKVKELTKDV